MKICECPSKVRQTYPDVNPGDVVYNIHSSKYYLVVWKDVPDSTALRLYDLDTGLIYSTNSLWRRSNPSGWKKANACLKIEE